jgi:excinuclease ABC subunit C
MRKCMPRTIFSSMNGTNKDIDPASELREEDEDSSLPELEMESATAGTLAAGRAAIARFAKLAPLPPASTA